MSQSTDQAVAMLRVAVAKSELRYKQHVDRQIAASSCEHKKWVPVGDEMRCKDCNVEHPLSIFKDG